VRQLRVGDRVSVPWGLEGDQHGRITEIWGDPSHPTQLRVEMDPADEEDEPVRLLLAPSVVKALVA